MRNYLEIDPGRREVLERQLASRSVIADAINNAFDARIDRDFIR